MKLLLFYFCLPCYLSNSIYKCYSKSLLNAEALTEVTSESTHEPLDYRLRCKKEGKKVICIDISFLLFTLSFTSCTLYFRANETRYIGHFNLFLKKALQFCNP